MAPSERMCDDRRERLGKEPAMSHIRSRRREAMSIDCARFAGNDGRNYSATSGARSPARERFFRNDLPPAAARIPL